MYNGFGGNEFFINHIRKFIGQTVTIFTTSGGLSGSGFTGVVLAVNCDFVRLVIQQGSAPTNPLNTNYNKGCYDDRRYDKDCCYRVGAVVDIPIDRIASFVHNAI
ncbi:hypothetical protein [Anaerocolumna sp. MB42-C2]|uniref:hypothetical protein n=1 Tax=Anaerocolumna sp. MB42-C2 TaxID=3070997 RepID=UPI0027DFC527|nr:hypothetical protein [Anaerocolumna sp. MB42-C2]WMJ86485.1 hypothetical protein RBU59_20960 [Anaerocolumna sp. MB42-C2]